MTEMIGHVAETAGHDEPKRISVTIDRNPRSRCRNHRSRWSEIRSQGAADQSHATNARRRDERTDAAVGQEWCASCKTM